MDLLAAFRKGGISRIERLLEEQNSLLRELITALGTRATTPRTPRVPLGTPKTADDVIRVGRETVMQAEREKLAAEWAPWRANGPDSAPTAATPGPIAAAPPASVPPR